MVAIAASLGACGGQTATGVNADSWIREEDARFALAFHRADSTVARAIGGYAKAAIERTEQTFEIPYRSRFEIVVYPNRSSMVDRWRQAWNQPGFQSQCWMVAAGWSAELSVLSPRVWASDACGHDGMSSEHVSLIVSHELVHVLHAQVNTAYGTLQTNAPWLAEGLAVYVSGQWVREYGDAARQAARAGNLSGSFQAIWSTSNGYALSGATIAYIADSRAFSVVQELLTVQSWAAALALLGVSEADLIAAVRTWLLSG